MQITEDDWINYKDKMAALSDKAAENLEMWLQVKGGYQNVSREQLIQYMYGLATYYGEATASLAAEMYDEVASMSGVAVPSAEVAETASYGEIASAVKAVTKNITTDSNLGNVVVRYVKRAAEDTTLKNVTRDKKKGAQFAWVPAGDTCAFCLMLASNGWQNQSAKAMRNGHASHIHPNCDCTYSVRFDGKSGVKGYDPDKYRAMYQNAEGSSWNDKLNSIRRIQYQENKDIINAQKRANYAEKNMRMKLSDNEGAFHTVDKRRNEDKKNIIKPRNIIKNLETTEIGKEALSLIDKNNALVELCYGQDNVDSNGNIIMGIYNPFNNKISVYVESTKTIMETAKTVIHEAFHISDYGMCQKSEVYCMMKEKQHEKGGNPLTKEEIKDIIKVVRKLYPQLPWEV